MNWPSVCTPKDLGGLGVIDLDLMNVSLLSKWLWQIENGSGLCIFFKYLQKQTLSQAQPAGASLSSGVV